MPEFGNRLDIICLESEAFYALVEEVVGRLKVSVRQRASPTCSPHLVLPLSAPLVAVAL